MNAAVLHALGEVPRQEQFPDPSPRENEVVVHVHAASLKTYRQAIGQRLSLCKSPRAASGLRF